MYEIKSLIEKYRNHYTINSIQNIVDSPYPEYGINTEDASGILTLLNSTVCIIEIIAKMRTKISDVLASI